MNSSHIAQLDEIESVIPSIFAALANHKTILFQGEMGAGKTTLIKSLCESLGVEDEVSSPTYALVNEYESPSGIIYHFDLFRLKSIEEALDLGIEDYLNSGSLCLIEWPELILSLLDHGVKIEIEKISEESRKFSIFNF